MGLSQYIGIQYGDHGRSRLALDCWGLVWMVYEEQFQIELPSYSEAYTSAEDSKNVERLINGELGPWSEVDAKNADFGDVLLFRIAGNVCHTGLMVSHGLMLHVMKGIDVCLERYTRSMWRHRLIGIYRHEVMA